ncbi:RAMP superfamily CRISPR-associated protein [Nocardia abscessus]|uniref:RAMP superfamily CRISPR-associated protein n=1 Tax=Nocardia abscessus TaxID=120957 RepID=UPI002456BFAF|nr:RAMP superfamily CRISPR-associated protein [Nocardia abscessus]
MGPVLVGTIREVAIAEQFVNPYTFVPFSPAAPVRRAPYGHSGRDAANLLSGRLLVTIEARTPLLIRGFGTDHAPQTPSRPDGAGGRESIIAGSSLHGAVRSLHEALTGSCLRVFDSDFVPQYRQTVDATQVEQLRLAVVTHASEPEPGQPQPAPMLRLCEPKNPDGYRLDQDDLARLHREGGLRSGDRLHIVWAERGQVASVAADPAGQWVVFLSDAGTREPSRPYRAQVRRLSEERIGIDQAAWDRFLELVEGADDLRTARVGEVGADQRFIEVAHTYKPKGARLRSVVVGSRHLARRSVIEGQPLWVRLSPDGTRADLVQLAMVWRTDGKIAAGQRIPPEFAACEDPDELCPSCRLFGSADTRGEPGEDGAARQRSYRGHVRFDDAVAAASVTVREVRLPPMSAPRPGAGQHYLETAGWAGDGGVPALREWGSRADDGKQPRRLRGRKFYWHTTVPNGLLPTRGQARAHHDDNAMIASARVYAIKSRFTATITFTDLDEMALGSLIVALQPHRVLGENALIHIGGGKPLGYGSSRITVDTAGSWVTTARARYTGVSAAPLDEPTLQRLAGLFAEHAETAVVRERTWPLLGAALELDRVPAKLVWYPPGDTDNTSKHRDRGFPYWQQTSGLELPDKNAARKGYPLQPLPAVEAPDQGLDIVFETAHQQLRRNKRGGEQR